MRSEIVIAFLGKFYFIRPEELSFRFRLAVDAIGIQVFGNSFHYCYFDLIGWNNGIGIFIHKRLRWCETVERSMRANICIVIYHVRNYFKRFIHLSGKIAGPVIAFENFLNTNFLYLIKSYS